MQYYVAHSAIKEVTFFNSITEALRNSEKSATICFIDDCALTGIQSNEIFQTLMGVKKLTDYEMTALSNDDKREFLKRKVGVCLSIVSDTAINGFNNTFKNCKPSANCIFCA